LEAFFDAAAVVAVAAGVVVVAVASFYWFGESLLCHDCCVLDLYFWNSWGLILASSTCLKRLFLLFKSISFFKIDV
jgi:hypothetical protein